MPTRGAHEQKKSAQSLGGKMSKMWYRNTNIVQAGRSEKIPDLLRKMLPARSVLDIRDSVYEKKQTKNYNTFRIWA